MLSTIQHDIRQFDINQWSITIDNLKHVLTTVYQDFQNITSNNIINSNEAARAMHEVCRSLVKNGICKHFINGNIEEHDFFLLFKNTIQFIFEKASAEDGKIGEREWKIYRVLYELLGNLTPGKNNKKCNKIIENIFFNDKYLTTFKKCIEKIFTESSFSSYELLEDVLRHFYIDCHYATRLTKPYLLHSVVKCILSRVYLQSLDHPANYSSKFFLEACPLYIVSCAEDHSIEIVELLCSSLINYFDRMINYKSCTGFVEYLRMLNICTTVDLGRVQFTEHIIQNLFQVLNWATKIESQTETDPNDSTKNLIIPVLTTKYRSLLAITLAILYSLTVNQAILSIVKRLDMKLIEQWKPSGIQPQNIDKFLMLCHMNDNSIRFLAQNLAALQIENIDRLNQPQQLTASYIVYLSKTVNGTSRTHKGLPLSSLIGNMKNVAHNKKVKEELVTQKGLPLLTKAACHEKFDVETIQQPALDVIWTVSFNQKAAELWKTDEKFVNRLKSLLNSNVRELEIVADGILWRLENEARFRADKLKEAGIAPQMGDKETDIDQDYASYYVYMETNGIRCVRLRKNLTDEERQQVEEKRIEEGKAERKKDSPFRYDLMMSYCSDNKELCHLIYDCLTKAKYNVWIDKEKMHGSLMERMAEAIEESENILVCMSSDYLKSQPCQSEAEYAYRRKRRFIFIKVEPKYTPNSWLGLLLANTYYVDFTKTDFASAFKDLYTQIHRHRRIEDIDYNIFNEIMTPTLVDNAATILKKITEKVIVAQQAKPTSNSVPTSFIPIVVSNTKSTDSNHTSKLSTTTSETVKTVPTELVTNSSSKSVIPSRSNLSNTSETTAIKLQNISGLIDNNPNQKTIVSTEPPSMTESIDQPDIRDEDFNNPQFFDENINADELYPDDFDFDYDTDTDDSLDYDSDVFGAPARSNHHKTSLASSRFSWSSISSNSVEDISIDPDTRLSVGQHESIKDVIDTQTKDKSHSQSASIVSTPLCWYENKPIDDWTQQEVFRFLNEKNLTNILTLFDNDVIVNGQSLYQLYIRLMPTPDDNFEILKQRLDSLQSKQISLADCNRFHEEMQKISSRLDNHGSVVCSIM